MIPVMHAARNATRHSHPLYQRLRFPDGRLAARQYCRGISAEAKANLILGILPHTCTGRRFIYNAMECEFLYSVYLMEVA